MRKLFQRAQKQVALPPGTIQFHGEKRIEKVKLTLIEYGPDRFEETDLASIDEFLERRREAPVVWLNVDGLHETTILEKLGDAFEIHPLVLEDIINTNQRPKLEDHHDYLYIVFRMLHFDENKVELTSEQISLVLGKGVLLTFQEKTGDVFDPVRERIQRGKGRARKLAPDYLAYALLDAVVDHYFVVMERIAEQMESMEEKLTDDPSPARLQEIHRMKREMIFLRKSVWPLREVVGGLQRSETRLLRKDVVPFLADLYDHTIQVIEAIESFREMTSGMQDLYMSSISNRMNEVMKVLTIIATIFVPLTFVAGIYGMNFDFMPELKWKWSYLFFWVVILAIGLSMLSFFRRRKWL